MADLQSFTLNHVTQEKADRLRQYIEQYGGSVSGKSQGVVENDCFTLDYLFSPTDQFLEIRPQKLDPVVTPAALRRSIRKILEFPEGHDQADTALTASTDKPTPTEKSCGVYLWVYGFIANNTALPLSVIGNYDTANCVSILMDSPLSPGSSITSTSTPIFKWKGQKNTFNTGACKIQYSIGQDTLSLSFQMQDNFPPDGIGVTATMSGTRFTAKNTTYSSAGHANDWASFLYIYLQIDNAS